MTQQDPAQAAVDDTRRWLERAVIGLNLCPFAKAVLVKGQVHFATAGEADPAGVIESLDRELDDLLALEPDARDTTLMVLTGGFEDFFEFNALAAHAAKRLRQRKLEGVVQLATFHPAYEFADADPGAISNFTNRSPWPTIHLLREASIERAVAAFPDPEAIYGANIATLERLGTEGWDALGVGRRR